MYVCMYVCTYISMYVLYVCMHLQGDFNNAPYDDNSFDAVYSIEATCHSYSREKVYGEVFRILKPGSMFAVYEWAMTDKYDPTNPEHRQVKEGVEVCTCVYSTV